MSKIRRTTATLGVAALIAAPLSVIGSPAHADGPEKERELRVAGTEIDFSVQKDDGRLEVEVDIDGARPGSRWKVVLEQDGERFHQRVHRADGDGDVEVEKNRRNTRGADVFKVQVTKVRGGAGTRVIRMQ